jgi:SpoVK/Ycf46/Vps4 family AAA+-type ATPase
MQDTRATGTIFYGVPGGAKSAVAKAAGVEYGIPTIQFDLGATKGSLVGQSEAQIREALKVINAVSGGRTLWIATCNSMTVLPPELKRRFGYGTWFFDLPSREERDSIWDLYLARYGLDGEGDLRDRLWTGAEIETCCRLAYDLSISVEKASMNIVPISVSGKEQIEKLQDYATRRFLAASYAGVYEKGKVAEVAEFAGRSFE